MARVLLMEDEPLQREVAAGWLASLGHQVEAVANGHAAMRALEYDSFDVAVLDWMVPGRNGEQVLRWLRQRFPRMPVLFATSQDEEEEIVHILGLGADDYLVKPLRRGEFLARVGALVRRATAAESADVIEAPPYSLQHSTRTVTLEGEVLKITPRMAEVAFTLFRKRGELVSREEIYRTVWGTPEPPDSRSLDVHVSRLRTALRLDGRHGWRLVAVYQHGYRLEPGGKPS